MSSVEIKTRDQEYVAHTYGRFPLVIEKGKGAVCYDPEGNKYIDLTSGIGVNGLGFCDDGWIAAVTKQLNTLQHTSNLYYTEPCTKVAEMLCKRTGMKKVFFGNSGAEANEGAIKAARKYSFMKYGSGRSNIVTLVNSFHGRTMATLIATGQEFFHNYFFPFPEGFDYAVANDFEDTVKKLEAGGVCAIMMEMVQGEGGVLPLEADYIKKVNDYCKAHDILVIVDEVQAGMGRTGKLFSYMHFDVEPDIVTCAKALGGGLPIGAILFAASTENALQPSDHAATFGANPVVCAGAIEVLNRMDDKFLSEVCNKGKYICDALLKMPHVKAVSGLGMMLGVTFEDGIAAKDVVNKCIEAGVLTLTAKTKLRLLPPLSITYAELDEALSKIEKTLAAM